MRTDTKNIAATVAYLIGIRKAPGSLHMATIAPIFSLNLTQINTPLLYATYLNSVLP